jgi:two-component system, chemotaxis family, CheB/CheR fusion protein
VTSHSSDTQAQQPDAGGASGTTGVTDRAYGRPPIVGVGASAGGIEAFKGFFENMPPDTGLAFIVVLHLPADRKSVLPEILARWTRMTVMEATEGCRIEPNVIYVPPSGVVVTLRDDHLHLHSLEADEPREPNPISVLFNSLAAQLHEDAIGVVLSGTGHDGALGLKAIKENGGLTLVQGGNGTKPLHDGMPASAIAIGAVDVIAPVEEMPGYILSLQTARQRDSQTPEPTPEEIDTARRAICAALHRQVGHDFSGYKDKTFLRRVHRRMHVLRLSTFTDYIRRLDADRDEAVLLLRDLLIGVTSFFRDTAIFDSLTNRVVPCLFHGKSADAVIRVWVPGCATGEEAYSLAMLLREYADKLDEVAPKLQVFATDIDEPAIATARAGRYPSTLLQGISADRLERFFTEGHDGSFTVAKDIREICTFSAHSLTRDPPFSRIDLVSCRNLLIYLDSDLQAAVIPAFHYSLAPDGFLLLGSSETVSRHEELFATIDRSHRVYQKRDVPSPPLHLMGKTMPTGARPSQEISPYQASSVRASSRMNNWANTRVLERFAPAFVVVTAQGNSLQYSNRIARFLEVMPGAPSQNVLLMARRELRTSLRTALKQVVETGRPVEKPAGAVPIAGEGVIRVSIVIEPRHEQGSETLYLVVFNEATQLNTDETADYVDSNNLASGFNLQTEAELRDTREQLQSVIEEHETSLEELRSGNEELHSVNEELQSTNEELETSKEEIQSINEELQTVNAQLAAKLNELDNKNNDLKNLFESTQVATLFLDPYLIIRNFTPAVANIYNLIPSDQGRPLTDIVGHLNYSDLQEDVKCVLDTLQPLERRVTRNDEAAHYLMRILPYRDPNSVVDGTIITFVEVTSIVRAEQHQRLLVDELNHRVKNMLTVVVSLAAQTIRRSGSLEEFSKNYIGRIHALTAAYSLLSQQSWQTVDLRELVMEELRPFLVEDRKAAELEGPKVLLEPRSALALGMAIHELTTNAVKYGALSVATGTVSVRWRIEHTGEVDELFLEWIENNGPRVTPPDRHGFGLVLIERGLRQDMSANVEVEFAAEGVRAKVSAPLSGNPPATAQNRSSET